MVFCIGRNLVVKWWLWFRLILATHAHLTSFYFWINPFPSIFLLVDQSFSIYLSTCGLILFHLSLDLFLKLSFSIYLSLSTSAHRSTCGSILLIYISIYLCINTFSSIHRSIWAFIPMVHWYIWGLILFIYSSIHLWIYSNDPFIYLWINPFYLALDPFADLFQWSIHIFGD